MTPPIKPRPIHSTLLSFRSARSLAGTCGVGITIGGDPGCYIVEHHLSRFVEGEDPRNVELMWDKVGRSGRQAGRSVRCGAVWFGAVQCSAVQCSAVQCSAVQCSAMKYRPIGAPVVVGAIF
jgi:hypothetical protein